MEAATNARQAFSIWLLSAGIGVASAIIGVPALASAQHKTEPAEVEVAFTPGDDIAALLVKRIGEAKKTVQVQAYLFTDRRIANALIAARRRGLEVEIIADAAQHQGGGVLHLKALRRAGVDVYLNASYASSHNKVIILDAGTREAAVVTGSYNFTNAAQSRNAENVVVISGNPDVTGLFVANFEKHRRQSTPWPKASTTPP